MDSFGKYLIELLSQFAGGRGELGNELVRFGLGMFFWGILFVAAKIRSRGITAQREKLLIWGFGAGLMRETLMFITFSLQILEYGDLTKLHAFFPPAEHALLMVSVVVVSAAFLQYILDNCQLSQRYLKIALSSIIIVYLVTFLWWGNFIIQHPVSKFGQVWCDWAFHITACILTGYALLQIHIRRNWISKVVSFALLLFILDDFLKLIDISFHEQYENILAPIRHSFHLLAILLLGYVYWQEHMFEQRKLQQRILEIGDLEKRMLGQDLHDGLIQQLTGINFFIEILSDKVKQGQSPKHDDCLKVSSNIRDAVSQARAISRGLYPVELDRSGLQVAIQELTDTVSELYGISCIFKCDSNINYYDIKTATHIFRILQESISNAARHSGATEIRIDSYHQDDQIIFTIYDNGRGFSIQDVQEGMGMQTIRYRAAFIRANINVKTEAATGTCIRLSCPIKQSSNTKRWEEARG